MVQKRIGGRIANEILMMLRAGKKHAKEVSLFEPIGTDKDGEAVSLLDVIETDAREVLEDMILDQDIRELYEAFESCLTDTERRVLGLRYGLYRGKEHTQREIAERMGISRSYVSRIEKKAVGKLRQRMMQE